MSDDETKAPPAEQPDNPKPSKLDPKTVVIAVGMFLMLALLIALNMN